MSCSSPTALIEGLCGRDCRLHHGLPLPARASTTMAVHSCSALRRYACIACTSSALAMQYATKSVCVLSCLLEADLVVPVSAVHMRADLQSKVLKLINALLPHCAARLHLVRRLGQPGRARQFWRAGRAVHAARADRLCAQHRRLRLVRHRGRLLPGGGRREASCQQRGQLRRQHHSAREQPLLAGALL